MAAFPVYTRSLKKLFPQGLDQVKKKRKNEQPVSKHLTQKKARLLKYRKAWDLSVNNMSIISRGKKMVWNFFLQRTIVLRPHQLYALFDSSNNALLHLFFLLLLLLFCCAWWQTVSSLCSFFPHCTVICGEEEKGGVFLMRRISSPPLLNSSCLSVAHGTARRAAVVCLCGIAGGPFEVQSCGCFLCV